MTKSQKKIFNRINNSEKWTCEISGNEWPNGAVAIKFRNNQTHVFLEQSGLMIVGKRGGCKIISMNVFATEDRAEFEKTCASLFCFNVFGYGKHPKIKIR